LCIVSGEVVNAASSLEHQEMVYHAVHEIAVVTHHNHTAAEVGQIFLQTL